MCSIWCPVICTDPDYSGSSSLTLSEAGYKEASTVVKSVGSTEVGSSSDSCSNYFVNEKYCDGSGEIQNIQFDCRDFNTGGPYSNWQCMANECQNIIGPI